MARRYELSDTVFSQVDIPSGQRVLVPADGQSFTVQDLRGNPLPIYTDEAGSTSSLSGSSSQGNLNGWVDAPDFDVIYPDGSRFSVRNTPPGVFNVKSYGARGDGVTEDAPAIQAAIDAAQAAGPGLVLAPSGDYIINGGLTAVPGKVVRIVGAGMGRYQATNRGPTTFRRSSGTATMLSAVGDGFADSGGHRVLVSLEDIAFDGGTLAGIGVDLQRGQDCHLHRVAVRNCAHIGLRTRELYNSGGEDIWITDCGTSGTLAAWVFDAVTGVGITGGSSGCWYSNVDIIGPGGTGLLLTGSSGDSAPTNVVHFTNLTLEGAVGAYPMIDLAYAEHCKFANTNITVSGTRTAVPIVSQHPTGGLYTRNMFVNTHIEFSTDTGAAYAIRAIKGGLQLANTSVGVNDSTPATALVRVEGSRTTTPFDSVNLQASSPLLRISDARSDAVPQAASAANITLGNQADFQQVTGTTTITSITASYPGRVVQIQFTGSLTLTDGSNLKLNDNYVTTADDTITLVCDGTNWIELSRSAN